MLEFTNGQIESWYHGQILRIPHGKQNPTKRYLTNEQILNLFDGCVLLQEKVDGKTESEKVHSAQFRLFEDMSGKQTVHKHVINYTALPSNKRIFLDCVMIDGSGKPYVSDTAVEYSHLNYATLYCKNLNISQIYGTLEAFSKWPSHFGPNKIEGLVIKNYKKQLFAKWVNDEFEDKLRK